MDIVEIRRKNLAEWFSGDRPIPPREKSYISQLLNGKSPFREKAARRLEITYGMGEMYLDANSQSEELSDPTNFTKQEIQIVEAFRGLPKVNKEAILVILGIKVNTSTASESNPVPSQKKKEKKVVNG